MLDFNVVLVLVVGLFISVGMFIVDFVWFGCNVKLVVLVVMVVFFFGNLLMFIFGVVGVVVLGMVDIFDVMIV